MEKRSSCSSLSKAILEHLNRSVRGKCHFNSMRQARANPVLIADDFEAFRRYLRARLWQAGFQTVVEASDGLEAVARAAELQPALVLLDIGMPNLDGLRATIRIRSVAPQAKVLFVSQHSDPDIVQAALSHGAAGYLCKFGINDELLPALEAVLAGKRFVCSECASMEQPLVSLDFASEFT
jgi:DNA-binding NarL/FixJ family response regulator